MISALLALALAPLQAPSPTDYFPLTPGIKRTYSDTAGASNYSDLIEPPVKVGDALATPLATVVDGKRLGAAYYLVAGNEIRIVATDLKKPFAEPQPFFQIGTGRADWTFKGLTLMFKDPVPINLKGFSEPGPATKTVAGNVETLKLVLDAVIGADPAIGYVSHQEIVLGKGIGMIEKKETVTIGHEKHSHVVKLIGFDRGEGA